MGLNDLQLSPGIIARLYPSSLIAPDSSDPVQISKPDDNAPVKKTKAEPASDPVWKSLGNNQKNILIVVNYTELVHLPDEEFSFLTIMLAACKLSLDDVVIINQNNYKDTGCKDLLAHFQSRTVFLFGVDPIVFGLPVGFPHFQVQNVAGCTFLFAPSLEENRTDKLVKSKLWVSLRSIFGI
jgi:hypothetical protein